MRALAEYTLVTVVGVLVLASLVGALMDRPVFMSYAYSESMTPTIDKGDLFFINPLARNPEVGDVIVFKAGDRWTVHRIAAITSAGYITKGDSNVATDQQSHNIPAIKKDQVAGTVVSINGWIPTIPRVGNYLEEGLTGRNKILIGGLLVIVGALAFTGGDSKRRRRGKRFYVVKFKSLYLIASALLIVMMAISIFVSWEVVPVEYAVTSAGGLRDGWYLPGEVFQKEITVENRNIYPLLYYVSGDSRVTSISRESFELGRNDEEKISITIKAPEETSVYTSKVRVNAYPHLLPASWISALYRKNPMLPLIAILAEIGAFLGVLYLVSGIGNEDAVKIRKRRTSRTGGILEVFRL